MVQEEKLNQNDTPIPSDILQQSQQAQNVESEDSLFPNIESENTLNDRPSPILTSSSMINIASNGPITNHRNRLINLQTINSASSVTPTMNGLPPHNVSNLGQIGQSPPLLSRNYSHNNFVQQNHDDFQRLLSISPPLSASLNPSNLNISQSTNNSQNKQNNIPSPTNLPLPHFLSINNQTVPVQDISININPQSNTLLNNINITPWRTGINNPMLRVMDIEQIESVEVEEKVMSEENEEKEKKEEKEKEITWQYKHCRCTFRIGTFSCIQINDNGFGWIRPSEST